MIPKRKLQSKDNPRANLFQWNEQFKWPKFAFLNNQYIEGFCFGKKSCLFLHQGVVPFCCAKISTICHVITLIKICDITIPF